MLFLMVFPRKIIKLFSKLPQADGEYFFRQYKKCQSIHSISYIWGVKNILKNCVIGRVQVPGYSFKHFNSMILRRRLLFLYALGFGISAWILRRFFLLPPPPCFQLFVVESPLTHALSIVYLVYYGVWCMSYRLKQRYFMGDEMVYGGNKAWCCVMVCHTGAGSVRIPALRKFLRSDIRLRPSRPTVTHEAMKALYNSTFRKSKKKDFFIYLLTLCVQLSIPDQLSGISELLLFLWKTLKFLPF